MLLFYAPDIVLNPELPEQESQHCVRVLRKQPGDEIDITDGKGYFYKAQITDAHPKQCKVTIVETRAALAPRQNKIEIAVAPTKNTDRMEWLVEKLTEIGVDTITFLKTRYSERKELKTDRIRKIVVSAMKQSEKGRLPEVQEMTDFKSFIRQDFEGQTCIAHCHPGEKQLLSTAYHKGGNVRILIGPEGDFSEEEVALALTNGFQTISLGDTRLRTETAALVACQTIHILNQLP
jgi:16S rRNA (uracil1498-N3)-methyltransferase